MPSIKRVIGSLLEGIITHPLPVLVIFIILTGLLGWQARHFEIDASADTLLMRNDPDYIRTQIINRRFSPQEFLLVAYKPLDRPLFSEETFKDIRTLSRKLQQLERVESVRSILNVPLFTLSANGISAIDDVSELTAEKQNYSMKKMSEAFRENPLYSQLLINKDQTATALQVLFKSNKELESINDRIVGLQKKLLKSGLTRDEEQQLSELKKKAEPIEKKLDHIRRNEIKTIRDIITEYEQRAEIYLGGLHVLSYQLIHIIKNDLMVFGSSIAAVICLILFLLFRKMRWIVVPLLCCSFSVLLTMGLFALLGFKTTVISSNFIVLEIILTLAIVIHLIVQYREYSETHPDWDQGKLVKETLLKKAAPCFYAGITTSVGFASLLFSGIQPVITFGWMMIIATIFAIGVSLVIFPAAIILLKREKTKTGFSRIIGRILDFFARLSLRHSIMVVIITMVIFGTSITGVLLLDVENSFINYFREGTDVHRELTFIDKELGGSTPLDIVYSISDSPDKKDLVMDARTVQTLQKIQHMLREKKAVGKILSVVNFTELAMEVNDDKPLTEYELTAAYRVMEDSVREDLLGSFFDPEYSQVRFAVRIEDSTEGLDRADLLQEIRSGMKDLGIREENYTLSSLFVLYQNILQQLFRSQILTLGIVFVVLLLTFMAIFRSIKIALIGIVPNILSTLAVLGIMGLMNLPMDLMTITIAAIAMSIAVDDTIHYIHRYREELGSSTPEQAIKRSHASVGYAVLYTTLIITLGFSMLSFSNFVPSVLFGLLTGFAMLSALAFDLCLLPVLLKRFINKQS